MEGCNPGQVLFPSENEIKSYFPEDVWNSMSDYERQSYRNMLHNYNVMKFLDLKPKKPPFMTLYSKKASKRKTTSGVFQIPIKKPNVPKKESLDEIKGIKVHQNVKKQKTNRRKAESCDKLKKEQKNKTPAGLAQPKEQQKNGTVFSKDHKHRSIYLHCTFSAVFHVYKKFNGSIKRFHPRNRKKLLIAQKYTSQNVEEKVEALGVEQTERKVEKGKIERVEKKVEEGRAELMIKKRDGNDTVENMIDKSNAAMIASDKTNKDVKENKSTPDVKNEGCEKPIKKASLSTKPVCRSVQTMTVADGCSPTNTALVFVNAASAKKLSVPFPDPKPLTPQQQKQMRKRNMEKMKNCRTVMTQTATDEESIETARLVFILLPKKPKAKVSSEKSDPSKNEELLKEDDQKVLAENPKTSVDVKPAQLSESETEIKVTPLTQNQREDDSSEDEFGFYALVKQQQEDAKRAAEAKSKLQPEYADLSAPSCSFHQPDTGAKVTLASVGTDTGSSAKDQSDEEDEFGFYALAKLQQEKIKKHVSLSTNPIPTLSQTVDVAVPGSTKLSDAGDKGTTLAVGTDGSAKDQPDEDDEFGFYALAKLQQGEKTKVSLTEQDVVPSQTEVEDSSLNSERRYPKRAVPVVNYTEAELLKDDEYLFCDLCDREYDGDCPEHGPHKFFPDMFVPVNGDDKRAIQTTPAMLKVDKSKIPGAGCGVWTDIGLPPHVRFGPYQGDEMPDPDPLGYSWAIVKDKRVDHYIAAHSTATSNWMRFVNCARHESEQNLMAFQYKGQMYYRTVKLIPPKAELFVWYGKEYAEMLGISMESFRSKDISHLRNVVFPCEKCNVSFTSPLYLEAHVKRCKGNVSNRLVKVDPSLITTDVQTLAVMVDGRNMYCCNLCDYNTKHGSWMKKHMMAHGDIRPYVCDICGRSFSDNTNLNHHKATHLEEKPFKCNECSYSCAQSWLLRVHMSKHTGERVYACSQCEYKTVMKVNMNRHLKVHSGDKPYCCTECDYRSAQKHSLTAHMMTHTGERPHCCTQCDFRTAHKHHLTTHMMTHTGERPHCCILCDFKTAHKPNLTAHMKTHSGVKPHGCPHCPHRTAWKNYLNKHIARLHPSEKNL